MTGYRYLRTNWVFFSAVLFQTGRAGYIHIYQGWPSKWLPNMAGQAAFVGLWIADFSLSCFILLAVFSPIGLKQRLRSRIRDLGSSRRYRTLLPHTGDSGPPLSKMGFAQKASDWLLEAHRKFAGTTPVLLTPRRPPSLTTVWLNHYMKGTHTYRGR